MQIPLYNTDITALEKKYALDVLNSPNLSLGPKLSEFEARLANLYPVCLVYPVESKLRYSSGVNPV